MKNELKKLRDKLLLLSITTKFSDSLMILSFYLHSLVGMKNAPKKMKRDIIVKINKKKGILQRVRKENITDLWVGMRTNDKENFARIDSLDLKNSFDVGANVGKFTTHLSKFFPKGKVFSFEPCNETFEALKENVLINKCDNVILRKMALSNKKGFTKLYMGKNHHGANSTSRRVSDKFEEVQVSSIDRIKKKERIKKVDFIKIDVEGGELSVLKGATKTLEKDRPHILFEALTMNDLKKTSKFLKNKGYLIEHSEGSDYFAIPKRNL